MVQAHKIISYSIATAITITLSTSPWYTLPMSIKRYPPHMYPGIDDVCSSEDVQELEDRLATAVEYLEDILEDTLAPKIDDFLQSIKSPD